MVEIYLKSPRFMAPVVCFIIFQPFPSLENPTSYSTDRFAIIIHRLAKWYQGKNVCLFVQCGGFCESTASTKTLYLHKSS
jgi:hypothetical protein